MPEVQTVFVQTAAPKGVYPGKCVEGCFIIESGVITLTNRRGDPIRDADGKTCTQKLNAGDNPKQIAGLMTKKFAKARRGPNTPPKGFSGPINYPKSWNSVA